MSGPAGARRVPDRGSAPALLLAALAVTALALGALGSLGRVAHTRSGARTAADLAALAAAHELVLPAGLVLASASGPSDAACRTARAVAQRNGAAVTRCAVADGGVVAVTAQVPSPFGEAVAVARAGPRERP